jgi:lipopolysaccharide/colanic/teichoic acid biosynthesis glycosyltransferase
MAAAQLAKRLFDLVAATLLLIALSPVILATSLAILVLEGRPIFYVSRRHVSPNRTIPVFKFRSMVRDAASPRYRLAERYMRNGYLDIPRECEVYTPIGRLLEKFQFVELPQLVNVIVHGMSLIGNRPLPSANLVLLREFDNWETRFRSPAGISGITQVVGKLGLQPGERIALEVAYARLYLTGNVVKCDFWIFWHTLRFILFSRGISLEHAFRLVGAEADWPRVAERRASRPAQPVVAVAVAAEEEEASVLES